MLLLSFAVSFACAQSLKGKIVDADTRQGIPFAVVMISNSNKGVTADLDGNFELALPVGAQGISVQLIGYEKQVISLQNLNLSRINTIPLKASEGIGLTEVVIRPLENPAIPIIRQVIENMPKFDIHNLPHYICNTYAKTYFTISDKHGNENIPLEDTTQMGKLFNNAYLLFMESVTEKKYKYKNIVQEKVLASKVSGFQSAPFGAFASLLQSFTFYDANLEVMGLRYVNPLSHGTFKRYNFEITDTVLNDTDTTLLIRFFPKTHAKFKALKGVLYIYKNQYVLANVLAEPSDIPIDGNGIKIQQLYEKIDSIHWFPRQANTEMLFYSLASGDEASSAIIKGVSRMYMRDIRLDTAIVIKDKSIVTYNTEGFGEKNNAYWKESRRDTLTPKELKTYQVVDSLGKISKLDKKMKWLNALGSGQIEIGYVNLDLKHILRVNDYEGTRLGLGLSTSNNVSRFFSIGGYGGYGIGDKAWKYGGHLRVNADRRQTIYVLAEAASEVMETAGIAFLQESSAFLGTEKLRNLLISKMDKVNYARVSLNFPFFHFIKTSAYLQVQERQSPFGYALAYNQLLLDEKTVFQLNEVGLQLKIWPHEKFAENAGRLVSLGSKWPVLYMNLSRGLTTPLFGYTGDFEYTKIDLRIDHQLNFKVKGFLAWQVQAGKVFGSVPYSIQYNNKSARNDRYWLSIEKTFETMYLNEFTSTQYVALFLALNTGKVLTPNKFSNPELELVHNVGLGTLDNRQNLTNMELHDMRKGYTEAGLRIKNLYRVNFSSLGVGVFYRYGEYAAEEDRRNLVYKAVLSVSF